MKKVLTALVLVSVLFFGVRPLQAEVASGDLKTLSEKQDRILELLEEIKSELQVVKIRVSSR